MLILGCFECCFEVDLCDVLRLFEVIFEVVSSVLRFEGFEVVLSVVLRLFEGCFEVVRNVALGLF